MAHRHFPVLSLGFHICKTGLKTLRPAPRAPGWESVARESSPLGPPCPCPAVPSGGAQDFSRKELSTRSVDHHPQGQGGPGSNPGPRTTLPCHLSGPPCPRPKTGIGPPQGPFAGLMRGIWVLSRGRMLPCRRCPVTHLSGDSDPRDPCPFQPGAPGLGTGCVRHRGRGPGREAPRLGSRAWGWAGGGLGGVFRPPPRTRKKEKGTAIKRR